MVQPEKNKKNKKNKKKVKRSIYLGSITLDCFKALDVKGKKILLSSS